MANLVTRCWITIPSTFYHIAIILGNEIQVICR